MNVVAFPSRRDPSELRRFFARGKPLTMDVIRGPWRPSGSAGGLGAFSVVWQTPTGHWFAPLHDFEPADQLRLIAQCRTIDQEAQWRRTPR